jgi:hypothetical protein
MRSVIPLLFLATLSCDLRDGPEDWSSWYDSGEDYDVLEPVEFTDAPYDLPAVGESGIGDLLNDAFDFPRGFGTNLAEAEFAEADAECDNWYANDTLPVEITGVVTVHPRFYFKTNGCGLDDEKYYGSYFIEDSTGGIFVLGDSKVAHFDMGDTVTLRIRAVRRSFGLDMVYVHDVLSIDRETRPIAYVVKQAPFGDDDMGEVRRVTGTVVRSADNFGEVLIQPEGYDETCSASDPEHCVVVGLDIELSRRGISFNPGERVTLTGPILYSYSAYSLVLTRVGQIIREQ